MNGGPAKDFNGFGIGPLSKILAVERTFFIEITKKLHNLCQYVSFLSATSVNVTLCKDATLLVSHSEYPRGKPFLLTMVSYLEI